MAKTCRPKKPETPRGWMTKEPTPTPLWFRVLLYSLVFGGFAVLAPALFGGLLMVALLVGILGAVIKRKARL